MTHLPVRWRLTLAFACVMAVLLAAAGLFVRQQVEANLDRAIDVALRTHAADIATLAQQSDTGLAEAPHNGVIGQPAQLAQIVDPHGRVIDATAGLPARPLLDAAALARARAGSVVTGRAVVFGDQPVRLLAVPIRAQGQRLIALVGQPLDARNQTLHDLTSVLLVGGPAALILASLAGYALTGAALRPVEIMRRRERAFIADASHELRTPLTMLRTELELMARDRPDGAQLSAAIASAVEETERLGLLADDLTLLTRADNGRVTLRTASVSPGELIDAAAVRARRRGSARDVRIVVRDAAGSSLVVVDQGRIGQAIDNMLDNALRHAEDEVEVTARVVGGASVEIHVLDDGPGFPPGFLPRAWDRFSRADSARTDEGTGLGLSIVRTIAEMHEGRADAVNRPEGGADVWIRLPGGV